MKRMLFPTIALAVLLPALSASDKSCRRDAAALKGMPLTEVRVLQVTIDPSTMSPIVLIQDLEQSGILPIVIGSGEALAIAMILDNVTFPRPMTHDLIRSILDEVRTPVVKVVITDLKEDTFYAVIVLRYKGKEIAIDSRPSDAIAVAVRTGAPIFVSTSLFRSKAIQEGVRESRNGHGGEGLASRT
jgi:bifunctional DNase/RNase